MDSYGVLNDKMQFKKSTIGSPSMLHFIPVKADCQKYLDHKQIVKNTKKQSISGECCFLIF